jgi:hypothetical protein
LRETDGSEKGSRLSSIMARWQRPTRQEVGVNNQISPPVQPLTLPLPANPCPVVNRMG